MNCRILILVRGSAPGRPTRSESYSRAHPARPRPGRCRCRGHGAVRRTARRANRQPLQPHPHQPIRPQDRGTAQLLAVAGRDTGGIPAAACPPGRHLLKLSSYLHDRTGGMIGSLSHLVREAALDAILDGSERIARASLERVDPDESAEQQNLPRARQHGPASRNGPRDHPAAGAAAHAAARSPRDDRLLPEPPRRRRPPHHRTSLAPDRPVATAPPVDNRVATGPPPHGPGSP